MSRYQRKIDADTQATASGGVFSHLRRKLKPRAAAPFKRSLLVETLEQRVLMDADPLAVATVNGRIDSAGEVDRYVFTLDNTTNIAFDSLVENGSLRWSLSGPSGVVVNQANLRAQGSSDPAYAPLRLGPGEYTLAIDGSLDTVGDYSFRLLDLSRATAISTDTAVTGAVGARANEEVFALDAQAGDRLFLDWVTRPGDGVVRLYDPFGNAVGSTSGYGGDTDLPVLPFNGRYTVVLDTGNSTTAGALYNFRLHKVVAPSTALAPFTDVATIAGTLAGPGDSAVFTFSLAQARKMFLDSATANDNLRFTIKGPGGIIRDATGAQISNIGLNTLDQYYVTRGVLDLPAGDYTVTIDGSGVNTGDYLVRLLDAATPTAVQRGVLTSGVLSPGNEVQIYSVAVAAGDRITIDAGTRTGGNPVWTLLDPYGRVVTYTGGWSDTTTGILTVAGNYLFVVRGENNRTADTSYSFTLVDAGNTPQTGLPAGRELVIGSTQQQGSLGAAGASEVWRFTLSEDKTLYFDPTSVMAEFSTFWSLQGPRGLEVNNARFGGYIPSGVDDGGTYLRLPAGDYALTVRSNSALPSYKFRLLDLANPPSVAFGTQTVGQLDPGGGMAAYSFNAQDGDRIYLDTLAATTNSLQWRIVDPQGNQLQGRQTWNATGSEFVLAGTGRYTLLVEGANGLNRAADGSDQPVNYRFALYKPQDKSIELNAAGNGIPAQRWTADGANAAVFFDGSQLAEVPASAALDLTDSITVQTRLRLDSFDKTWQNVFYKGGTTPSERQYTLWVNSQGYLYFTTANGGETSVRSANGSIEQDKWYDVTGVINRGTGQLTLYIDGVQVAQSTISNNAVKGISHPGTPLYIGDAPEANPNAQYNLKGAISELRVWSRALSAAEITTLRSSNPTVDASLRLWLPMNEGSGTSLADASSQAAVATLKNNYAGVPRVTVGSIDVPGQRAVYHLNLATPKQFFFDSLTMGNQFRVSINGPDVAVNADDLSNADMNRTLIDMPAGDYTITIDGYQGEVGAYAFRLLDQADATLVALDTPVNDQLNPGDGAKLYQFEVAAGEVVFFDALSNQDNYVQWRLLDPFGRNVFTTTTLADRDNTTLAYAGRYTLVATDYYNYNRDIPRNYGFQLRKVTPNAPLAIQLGSTVDPLGSQAPLVHGRNAAGAVETSLHQVVEVQGDAVNQNGSFTVETWFKLQDIPSNSNWAPIFTKATDDALRQYGLWVNRNGSIYIEARGPSFNRGVQSAAGLVAEGDWHHVAAVFDRANSQLRIVLDGVQVASAFLESGAGLTIANALRLGTSEEGYPDHEGARVLFDELRVYDNARTAAAIAASMNTELAGNEAGLAALFKFNSINGAALADSTGKGGTATLLRTAAAAGGIIAGRIEDVGQSQRYRFTLTEAKQLYFDSLTHRTDLQWSLNGPTVALNNLSFYSGDSRNDLNLLSLPAGDYEIVVKGQANNVGAVGDYQFRLVDAGQATPLALDTVVDLHLDPGTSAKLFRFNASAGQRLFFDAIDDDSLQPIWRLLDPSGAQVFGVNNFNDIDTLGITRSGTYTLIVEDYTASGQRSPVRDVQFAVRTVSDRNETLVLGNGYFNGGSWTAGPSGASGTAVKLQGNHAISANSPLYQLGGSYTVEAMVKLDGYSNTWMPLVSRGDEFSHQNYGLWLGSSGQVYFDSNSNGSLWNMGTANGVLPLNEWHRVSATVDRSAQVATLYIDGVAKASRNLVGLGEPAASPASPLLVGNTGISNGDRSPLLGSVADVRLWSVARSAAQVTAAQGTLLAGNEAGLVLNWKLNEGAGGVVADSSPNHVEGDFGSINAGLRGTVVEGRIDAPGSRVIYTLTPATDRRVVFDSLNPDSRLRWSLTTASGVAVFSQQGQNLSNLDLGGSGIYGNQGTINLRAGQTYLLTVDATGDLTDHYAFRLVDVVADAQTIPLAQPADTYTLVSGPSHGTLDYRSDGGWDYQPDNDYNGLDSFTYAGTDAAGNSFGGEIVIQINPTNDFPQTFGQEFFFEPGAPSGVQDLSFDAVADEPGSFELVIDVSHGVLDWLGDGRFEYTPDVGFEGQDFFQWKLVDGNGDESFADIYIDVHTGNTGTFALRADAAPGLQANAVEPLAVEPTFIIDEDTGLSVSPAGEGSNASTVWRTQRAASSTAFSFTAAAGDQIVLDSISTNQSTIWSLFGPNGVQLYRNWSYADSGTLTLAAGGRYSLVFDSYAGARGVDYGEFRVRKVGGSTVNPLPQGTAVNFVDGVASLSAALANQGDTAVFNFSLPSAKRLYVDTNTTVPYYQWKVLGTTGELYGDTWNYETDAAQNFRVLDLPAGNYAFSVTAPFAGYAGTAKFRLIDVSAATPIVLGSTVTGTLDPQNSAKVYSLSGNQGDRLYFDSTSYSNNAQAYWRLVGDDEVAVASGYFTNDLSDVALPRTGGYKLFLDGQYNYGGTGAAASSFAFSVRKQQDVASNINLDTVVTGTLAGAGDRHLLNFSLSGSTRLWMDSQTNRSDLNWTVQDADGFTVAGGRDLQEYPWEEMRGFTLPAGNYRLVIDGDGAAVGDYRFSLLNMANATPLTPGTVTSGQLAPGSQADLYSFDAVAGSSWYFDRITSAGNAYWRLLDPYGQPAFAAQGLGSDRDVMTLDYTGKYTLVIDGYPSDSANLSYSFNVLQMVPQAPVRLSIGVQPAPNLVVQDVAVSGADGSIHSGGVLNVNWFTANTGDSAATGSFQERVLVSNSAGQTLVNQLVQYSNANGAADLAPGARAARSAQIQLPAGAAGAGALTVSVVTDVANAILEKGSLGEADNSTSLAINSTLLVYPDLTVSNLAVSPTAGLAAGAQVSVTWQDVNSGDAATPASWVDRVQVRNRNTGALLLDQAVSASGVIAAGGSSARQFTFNWPTGANSVGAFDVTVSVDGNGTVAEFNAANSAETNNDATVSFVNAPDLTVTELAITTAAPASGADLSLSWKVNNSGNAATPTGWFDRIVVVNTTTGQTLNNVDVFYEPATPLAVGASQQRNFTLRLPAGAASAGNLRINVIADQNAAGAGTLSESNEANNAAQVLGTAVLRNEPNLVASSFTAPATHRSGDAASFGWTVTNSGNAATGVASWFDRIVMSSDATIGNGDDITVATVQHTGALEVGASYTVNLSQAVPGGYDGAYTFAVVTDALNNLSEPDRENDNVSNTVASTLTAYHADLVPSVLALPASATGGSSMSVSWQVSNQGDAATSGGFWYDRLWLSLDGTLANAINLGSFAHSGVLGVGQSYNSTQTVTVPNGVDGRYKLIVQADPFGYIFESRFRGNNDAVSAGNVLISQAPAVDLRVQSVSAPALAQPGQLQTLQWTVANTGQGTAQQPWTDRIYISRDGTLNSAVFVASLSHDAALAGGASYQASAQFYMPDLDDGSWRFLVVTDINNQVFETGAADAESANSRAATAPTNLVHPDLVAMNLALTPATAGQAATLTWQARNDGSGEVLHDWLERVFLSADNVLDGSDQQVAEISRSAGLAAGASVAGSATFTLPKGASGSYRFFVVSDATKEVRELGGEANNQASISAVVAAAPLPNLSVANISAPAQILPGRDITVNWSERNSASAEATGPWNSQVFLSTDANIGGDIFLGSASFSGSLAAGAEVARSASFTLPTALAPGNYRLVVRTDAGSAVVEGNELDNAAISAAASVVPAALKLNISASTVNENANGVSATVVRNGDLSQPLVVNVLSSDTSEATVPATVTIAAGQSSATFSISVVDDGLVDGAQTLNVSVSAPALQADQQALTVQDSDVPALRLSTNLTVVENQGTALITLTRNGGPNAPALDVRLSSANILAVSVPPNVSFAAGQNSLSFLATLLDDQEVWGTRDVNIVATAPGYVNGALELNVIDDDLPQLTIELSATQVSEGAGVGGLGITLKRDRVGPYDMVVYMNSSDKNSLTVPTRVVFPAGGSTVFFNANLIDDLLVDGDKTVVLKTSMITPAGRSITQNISSTLLTVTDNDGPTLSVTLDAESVSELGGTLGGTVRRNTGTSGNLVVNLASSDTTELTTPATVTILDGQSEARFSVTPVADGIIDRSQAVTVLATAAGFNGGSAALNVTEGDLPDLVVSEVTIPASGLAKGRVDVSWTVENAGRTAAAGGFRDRVFLSLDPALSTADTLLASVLHSPAVAAGGSYTQSASIQLPETTGKYYLIIVSDPFNAVEEGSERNNVGASAVPIDVQPPLVATISTTVTQVAASLVANATVVPFTGRLTDATTGAAVPNSPLKVMIRANGVERFFQADTDADGNFKVNYYPLPGETGLFEVGAGYLGTASFAVQDSFKIIGMGASVPGLRLLGTNETALEGSFTLKNLTDVPLSSITARIEGVAQNFDFFTTQPAQIGANGEVTVFYKLVGHGVTDALQASRGTLVLTSAEGAESRLVLDLAVIPQTPKLVATPGFLAQGMLVGKQTLVSFDIMNQGAAESGPIDITLPSFPWLKLVTPAQLASLKPGESTTVTLALSPDANLELIRYDGTIAINAKLNGFSMPFQFRAVSQAVGDFKVTVEDQLTYYAEGAPKLAGATVTLVDPYTSEVIATGKTGADGSFSATGLAEGTYIVTVQADKHASYRATQQIKAGTLLDKTIFLDRQLVSYTWNVVPVETQDRYKITLESTFETEVPVPVITADPLLLPLVFPGKTSTTMMTVTNHGLIQATDVRIQAPSDDIFEIKVLTPVIDVLPANSSIQVPIEVRIKDGVTPEQLRANSLLPQVTDGGDGSDVQPQGWVSAIAKCLGIDTYYKLQCGADGRWYAVSTKIDPVLCGTDLGENAYGIIKDAAGPEGFNLLKLPCNILDAVLSCFTDNPCLAALLNGLCGAAVGFALGGPAGAAAGAAGAASDLLACLCTILPPLPSFNVNPSSSNPGGWGGGPWGWYTPGGSYSGTGAGINIQYVNCRGEPVSAQDQALADQGVVEAVAAGVLPESALPANVAAAAAAAAADGSLETSAGGICAQVRIQIEQEAVLTRTAFQGTLEVVNGNTGIPLTGLSLNLDIRDENGNAMNDMFAIRGPVLNGMTAVDGSGVIVAGGKGSAQYMFIPRVDAAPDAPTKYRIGGTLSYVENGQKITVPLLDAQITVYPEARLNLHYFQQRDVYSDDPFTKEVVEPSEPFSLGLLAYNDGKGDARNFSITSAQPKIIENDKGLLIDFKIVGTQVGDKAVAPTLTANLGNIAAGKTQVAQWLMTSSLQGKFVDYSATFEHVDGLGDTRLSLIESVNIHELIRAVRVGAGDAPDFLANDDPDTDHTPDRLYTDDGTQYVVRSATGEAVSANARLGALSVQLTADVSSGWNYFKLPDPGVGYKLDRIVRSDGTVLTEGREVWRTDRSFPSSEAGAVRENLLHFIDKDSTGRYTLVFKIDDAVAPVLTEITPVSPDPRNAAVDHIDVRFSEEIDLATFTFADLTLTLNGAAANLIDNSVTVTSLGGGQYRIGNLAGLTAADGLYKLSVKGSGVVDYAGNAGSGLLVDSWGKGDVGPYVLSLNTGAAQRNSALASADITFNTALDASSFSADDLRLTRNGVVVPLSGLSLAALGGSSYRLSGLAPFTAADGDYQLTVIGTGLLSATGKAGLDQASAGWKMDTVAPQVIDIVDLVDTVRNTVVMALDVTLSEEIALDSFDFRDLNLTRTVNGVRSANLIDDRVSITHLEGSTYRITGFNWVVGPEGLYTLSVNGAGLRDAAGNAGDGSAAQSWTMDFHDPEAPSNIAIAPDSGASSTDFRTNVLAFNLSGSLSEPGLKVRVSDRTTGVELGYANVTGTQFSMPVNLNAAGKHELRIRAVDAAGNLKDATVLVFVDQVRPTLDEIVPSKGADQVVNSIELRFSEGVDPATVTVAALKLVHDGAPVALNGVTITRLADDRYRVDGLHDLMSGAGSFQFSVDITQIRDVAGNAGTEAATLRVGAALASVGSVSGLVFDDVDGNGSRSVDELGAGGWTVFDDANGNARLDDGEASTVSDANGNYELNALSLGEHRIMVLAPAGWVATPANPATLNLTATAADASAGFGVFRLASLEGTVYNDSNASLSREALEAGLAGRLVFLDTNSNGVADAGERSTRTDELGHYSFADVQPGTYKLVLNPGDGWLAANSGLVFAPSSGLNVTRDLAAMLPGGIEGVKFEDLNGNSLRDAGERGLQGWTIFIDANGNDVLDGNEQYDVTDTEGRYSFGNLLPGSYRLVEQMQDGWIQTAPGPSASSSVSDQSLDAQISLPSMISQFDQNALARYFRETTGLVPDCGCSPVAKESFLDGQAATVFDEMEEVTNPFLAGLTGQGVRVAVIDTGIDTKSSFFGPDSDGDGVADRIVYQYDFGDNDADASDTMGHGTHIAGVIGGDDGRYAGIATDADLVVLKVFDVNQRGFFSTLKRALEWLEANAEKYNIGVVNMSLGDGGNWGAAIGRYGMGDIFARLAQKGLITIGAGGNNYFQNDGALGLAYPASDPAVIGVGALWGGNFGGPWRFSSGATDYETGYERITSFTQRDPSQTDVMAIGARFTSAGLNGSLATMQGTSQAAAYVSGTAALVQQAAKAELGRYLTTGEFAELLKNFSYKAYDGDDEADNVKNSFATYKKLDLPKLLAGFQSWVDDGRYAAPVDGDAGDGSGDGSGAPLVAYTARVATVVGGETTSGQDFGNFKLGQAGGVVFSDTNGDGQRQAGEGGLSGLSVFLDANNNGSLDAGERSTTTNAQGSFLFDELAPGVVTVRSVGGNLVATTAVTQQVTVTSGLNLSTLQFGYATPITVNLDAVNDEAQVQEDGSVTVNVLDNDQLGGAADVVLSIHSAPAHGTVAVVNGQLQYQPAANFNGDDIFEYTITAAGGANSTATVTVKVLPVNDAPTLAAIASRTVDEGSTLSIDVQAQDIDVGDSLLYSLVSAPQGASIDPATGRISWLAGAVSTTQNFVVKVSDAGGLSAQQSFTVDVRLGKLVVTAFDSAPWGFSLRFNDVVDASKFNLYGSTPDLVVSGARVGAVKGSVVFDEDGKGLSFIRTGAGLEADRYTVTLRGAADSLSSSLRGVLDGDANGSEGGNLVRSFDTAAPPAVRLRLPDFARGPGQAVAVPNTAAGLPITLTTDGSATSIGFRLSYDPALLQVSALNRGADLPSGATLNIVAGSGYFDMQISGATLPAGTRQLLNLVGTVSTGAAKGASGALRIGQVSINGNAAPQAGDAAVQFVGYVGDLDFSGNYTAADMTQLQRLVVKADTFLAGAPNTDATVIADVDGNGVLTSVDAALVNQRVNQASTPLIPAIPPVVVQPVAVAPLSVSSSSGTAAAGGTTLNLNGSFSNFALPAATIASSSTATAASTLPVSLKIVPSAVSTGVKA